ncbi:MAG: DUF1207 domain-containing protein [Bacteroidota bacterium]
MKKLIVALFTVTAIVAAADEGFSYYNGPLNFKPLVANTFEPRIGLIWHANDNRLRLDIGNSVDLIQYRHSEDGGFMTVGADFFTYTMLRGEKNFHFPVDAVDYLFGFNVNYRDTLNAGIFTSRLRISHISAHFVDGHFDGTTGVWKDGMYPRVYSREFVELTIALEPAEAFRWYAGGVYLWHVDPTSLPLLTGYAGGEYHYTLSAFSHLFGAYQFTATGLLPRHELMIGTKFGKWQGRGTQFFFTYHYGNSIHGEYYDRKDEYSGLGFSIDF